MERGWKGRRDEVGRQDWRKGVSGREVGAKEGGREEGREGGREGEGGGWEGMIS